MWIHIVISDIIFQVILLISVVLLYVLKILRFFYKLYNFNLFINIKKK